MTGDDKADVWTKPGGINFDPESPRESLGNIGRQLVICRMDGATHAIPAEISDKTLLAAIRHADEESIDLEALSEAVSELPPIPPGIVLRTKVDLDRGAASTALQIDFGPFESGFIDKTQILRFESCIAAFADDRTLLIGVEDSIGRMLMDRIPTDTSSEEFRMRFPGNDVALSIDFSELRRAASFLEDSWLSGFASIDSCELSMDIAGEGKSLVRLDMSPVDPDRIDEATEVVQGLIYMLRESLSSYAGKSQEAEQNEIGKLLRRFEDRKSIVNTHQLRFEIPKPDDLRMFLDELQPGVIQLLESIRESKERTLRVQPLERIGKACLDYCDIYDAMPSALGQHSIDERQWGLSWRVHLLPRLGQADLYSEFHLDEPWDSEHNKTLIVKMPDVFKVSGIDLIGYTSIHAIIGPGTPLGSDMIVKLRNILDGPANTIMFLQADNEMADVWTRPGGIPFNSDMLRNGLGKRPSAFWAVMCDGSAKLISTEINDDTLRGLMQIDEGTVLGEF